MAEELDTTVVDDKAMDADFGAGFSGEKSVEKPATKPDRPEPAAPEAAPAKAEEAPPEYVQVTRKDWDDVKAAAARTASYDGQFSKIFGTVGNIQKMLNEARAKPADTPAARKIAIDPAAFAEMSRDFPELAQQTKAALEAALSGLPSGASDVDPAKLESMLSQYQARREIEALEDAWPDWRTIVGAVDVSKEQPNPDNPFRKWLGTKDAAYQQRINGSESAQVIGRAIRLFQNETKAVPAKPAAATPRDTTRADRIRAAVQPRGDNAGAASGKSDDDEFLAGFNSR